MDIREKTIGVIEVDLDNLTQLVLLPYVYGRQGDDDIFLVISQKAGATLPFLQCVSKKEAEKKYGEKVADLFQQLAQSQPKAESDALLNNANNVDEIAIPTQGETKMSDQNAVQTKIGTLKVKLYDVIEHQAMLSAKNQELEQQKQDLAKQLGAARQELEAAKAAASS